MEKGIIDNLNNERVATLVEKETKIEYIKRKGIEYAERVDDEIWKILTEKDKKHENNKRIRMENIL